MQTLAPDATERNYAKAPLTRAEIERLVKAVGDVATVLNTRHAVAKANGWKERAPSRTAFAKAAAEDNNLLRRPVIQRGARAIVSRDAAEIRAFLR